MRGFIHVYTGNGKGKTTAALGLSLRAAGAGKRVFIAQFVKGMVYSEVKALKKLSANIEIKQYGLDCFIYQKPTQKDIDFARRGLEEVKTVFASQNYDLIVLDEASIAIYFKLFSTEELIAVLKSKPEATEVVITGRYAPDALIEFADLVTEMKEIKHYYTKGVEAREGVEY